MSELIVLTCASGKQCSHLVPLLYDESMYKLRLVVNSTASSERLQKQYPKAEVVQANLDFPQDCARILEGATVIYYIGPPFTWKETYYGINVVDAAVSESKKPGSKFAHFVFSSVLHPELTKLLNHDRKRYVEEHLTESMLPYTILQPSHFTDNAIGQLVAQKDVDHPVFKAPHSAQTAFSFTSLHDYAEASAKVIQERSKHFYATYQLVSTLPMKYTEYIKSIGEAMGKDVEIQEVPYEQSVGNFCERMFGSRDDVPQTLRDGPERLVLYYNHRGLYSNPNILEWLIGRTGSSPADVAKRYLQR
ncbi:hypothetical protein LTR10_021003 [Elasticomyces elasticus]|uniref:NmrA-like domain-containing protein n=1 Tax=Exophiala sideris TaxID=1016849 RepID=A0ABR0JLN3_9EURO|nr:hypothetical protein LTR10_021003 [Elasticomyces elasticus]KAK5036512.1 hypothetical protein LTS07_002239 [Exophiala sideris]KAK5041659.1 hypothetical protein LTR13_002326 [Exophiala sideris]KAK5066895.1 hypothetical protein LTR69_002243 [Exophiala sideris]KAK5184954.1 hypothetical protein LTR44_002800 [Eurotiomycetes sp. CCFEE 6388]